jgi:ribulose-5-phosphate 4-epimerase/fuculose-1-phosphate aldolase
MEIEMQRTARVATLDHASSKYPVVEWQARVDLAAAHRLADLKGYNEGIFNHFTLTVPGKNDRFLVIPFGHHWSEVTASMFMEVGFDGPILHGTGEVERSAYCIHAPIHRLAPNAACVLHTHMPFASAMTRLGLACDPAEGERLAGVLGSKKILFMANHGVLVVGQSVAEAFDRLYYLERACQVQLYAMWTGRPLKRLPDAVIAKTQSQFKTAPQYGGKPAPELHFAALKRTLERSDPSYKL